MVLVTGTFGCAKLILTCPIARLNCRVSVFRIEFQNGAVHLPELGLWLDAHDPQPGPERVFVSHAHSDHVEAHGEVILSAPTAKLMRARMGGQRLEHEL